MTRSPVLERAAGALVPFLDDPQIREIRCTSAGKVFTIHAEHGKQRQADQHPRQLDSFLALIADRVGAEWKESSPTLHAGIPELGIRVQASRPPVSPAACMVLRKHPNVVYPLPDWVKKGILTVQEHDILLQALADRKTICFAGAVGSSKTSLLNACVHACAHEIAPDERYLVIEDDAEVICDATEVEFQRTTRDVGGKVRIGMAELCVDMLRQSPDRVVIGELRGAEALPAMQAFQTGHPGLFTVHAPRASTTLFRLEQLVQITSVDPQQRLLSEAVNLIVHLEAYRRLWRCTNILAVGGLDGKGGYHLQSLVEKG